jgi:hypothetical protein
MCISTRYYLRERHYINVSIEVYVQYHMSSLSDDSAHIDIRGCLLDPFSTIVKLAILGNKPVGTKICIQHNVLSFQEPGPFQSFCRYVFHSNKTDLQYMYNPIHIACCSFLSKTDTKDIQRIRSVFQSAQKGLDRLMETYRNCTIVRLCLSYFHVIIANYVDEIYQDRLFRKDSLTALYGSGLVAELNAQWTEDTLKVVLDLVGFLNNDSMAATNVKSLETIMDTVDRRTREICERR